MKLEYKIKIGLLTIDSTELTLEGLPLNILVDLQLNRINSARFFVRLKSGTSLAAGDAVEIELGSDGTERVFTGLVEEISKSIQGWTVYCRSSLSALIDIRTNKLYEKQKAGDIINDIAQSANVSLASAGSGIEYPVYILGDDQSLFEHTLELAGHNGFDVYTDQEDKLVFAGYSGSTVHPFQYGINILDLELEDEQSPIEGVIIYGESPSSIGQGADAYSWLTKKEIKGTAGTENGRSIQLSLPVLKDLESTRSAAQAIFEQKSKIKSGWLTTPGDPDVHLGDALQISDIPDSSLNGTYRITGIRHTLSKAAGFITMIYWTET